MLTSRFAADDKAYGALLEPFRGAGVTQAQFFANAVSTSTRGVDLVAAYDTGLGAGGLEVSAAAHVTKTHVEEVRLPRGFLDAFATAQGRAPDDAERATIAATLFNREEQNRVEDALPHAKGTVSARYRQARFSALGRATYYGPVHYKPVDADHDETFGAKTVLDGEVTYTLGPGLRLSVGAQNLLNTFPDQHEKAANIGARGFVYSRRVTQFGTNGGFYYSRLQWDL